MDKLLKKLIKFPYIKISCLRIEGVSLDVPEFMEILKRVKNTLIDLRLDAIQITYETYCKMIRLVGLGLERLEMGTLKNGKNGYHRYFPLEDEDGNPMTFHKMKHLEFLSFNDNREEATKLSRIVPMFPNLKTLIACNVPPEKPEKFIGLRLDNLKTLQLRSLPYSPSPLPNFPQFCCRRMNYLSEGGIRTDHLDSLRNMQLKLKSIAIFSIHPSVTNERLKAFLEEHKDTLKNFELHTFDVAFRPTSTPGPVPFPLDLPNVKKADLNRPFIRNLTHVLNSLPKLETVDFRFPGDESCWGRILPTRLPQFQNLKSLTMSWIIPKHLTQLAKSFTGLTVFKIQSCDDECLRVIFSEMKTLEHLIVIEDHEDLTRKTTDEGFTGIPLKFLVILSKVTNFPRATDLRKVRKWPSVCDLKNLKTLTLKGKNQLTYRTLIYGVSGMEKLHYVAIKIRQPRVSCLIGLSARGLHFAGNHEEMIFFARENFISTVMDCSYIGLARHMHFDINPGATLPDSDDGDENWVTESESEED